MIILQSFFEGAIFTNVFIFLTVMILLGMAIAAFSKDFYIVLFSGLLVFLYVATNISSFVFQTMAIILLVGLALMVSFLAIDEILVGG